MAFDLAPGGCEVTDTSHLVEGENGFEVKGQGASCLLPVSYTHLTLPTKA